MREFIFSPDDEELLINRIYEAATIPQYWQNIFEDFSKISDSVGTVLFSTNIINQAQYPDHIATNSMKQLTSDYINGGWIAKNPRPAAAINFNMPSFYRTEDLYPGELLEKDQFRFEFLHPRQVDEEVATCIVVPNGQTFILTNLRRLGAAPVDQARIDSLTRLRRHIARAITLSERIGLQQAEMTAATFAQMGLPAAIISASGRVLAANALFPFDGRIFATGQRDALRVVIPEAKQFLDQALNDARSQAQSFPIAASETCTPAIIHVVPMPRDARDLFSQAGFVVMITELADAAPPPVTLLRGLFDLTPAEARIAQGLTEGKTLEDLAFTFNRSLQTVRTHLRSIFANTGTQKQAQLVSLLLATRPTLTVIETDDTERGGHKLT